MKKRADKMASAKTVSVPTETASMSFCAFSGQTTAAGKAAMSCSVLLRDTALSAVSFLFALLLPLLALLSAALWLIALISILSLLSLLPLILSGKRRKRTSANKLWNPIVFC